MTIKHLASMLAFACFAVVAACYVIGGLGRYWPRSGGRSFHALKQAEFTRFGWRLRTAAVVFSCLGLMFGIVSYVS